jgi:arylsulfatase
MLSASRPNVLYIYTDQQRWDALGANGNRDIKTPHLDRLAARSVNFDRCFVQHPLCMPSRASFLSGRYPSSLGIAEMGVPMPEEMPHFATYFGSAGYHCANLGKLHFLPHANRDHTQPHPSYGFDQLEISDEPGVYEDAYRAWARRHFPDQLPHLSAGLPPARKTWLETMGWKDGVAHCPATEGDAGRHDFLGPIAFPGRPEATHSAFVADRVEAYLRSRSKDGQPFACIAGFYSPHAPWRVPQAYLDRYDPQGFTLPEVYAPAGCAIPTEARLRAARHGYYAMVSEIDDCVGRLLDTLDETGLAKNCIIVFTSDHGEWLGEGGLWGKGYPADDACSRVPLLLAAPGLEPARISRLVEAVDVLPTVLALAGLPVSSRLQGRSLLEAPNGAAEEATALTESAGWRSLRSDGFRYVAHGSGEERLFDLAQPGGAWRDVSAEPSYASELARHRRLLIARMIAAEQPRERVWPY